MRRRLVRAEQLRNARLAPEALEEGDVARAVAEFERAFLAERLGDDASAVAQLREPDVLQAAVLEDVVRAVVQSSGERTRQWVGGAEAFVSQVLRRSRRLNVWKAASVIVRSDARAMCRARRHIVAP